MTATEITKNTKLPNKNLVEQLQTLVRSERKITAEIIEIIREVDCRRLYLDYNHPSLFSFLTKNIGYTPAAAQRRIEAARLLREVPELKNDLQSGDLNLTQVSLLAQCVRQKQKEDPQVLISTIEKRQLLEQVKTQDLKKTEKIFVTTLNLTPIHHEKISPQRDETVRLELTLSTEQLNSLNQIKKIISHVMPNPSLAELVSFLANEYLKRKDPRSQAAVALPTSATVAPARHADHVLGPTNQESRSSREQKPKPAGRRPSAANRRLIFQRDRQCQWRDKKTGTLCGSEFQLQIDHRHALWLGGTNEPENLQLLCSVHNKLKYEHERNEIYGLIL